MKHEIIKKIKGPILILGANGFIGSNLNSLIRSERHDCWGMGRENKFALDNFFTGNVLEDFDGLKRFIQKLRPQTIFNCISYGNRPQQIDQVKMMDTNVLFPQKLLNFLKEESFLSCFVQLGSSSEYGEATQNAEETETLLPNSPYALSKKLCYQSMKYYAQAYDLPILYPRLFSVYGPGEDEYRLMPQLLLRAQDKKLPALASPQISRDFVYIEDACTALIHMSTEFNKDISGEAFNICSGQATTLAELAELVQTEFGFQQSIVWDQNQKRSWDHQRPWFGNPQKTIAQFSWRPSTPLLEGIRKSRQWMQDNSFPSRSSTSTTPEISIIVAVYKDEGNIEELYRRIVQEQEKAGILFELILVDDGSPDQSWETIQKLAQQDSRIKGVRHSNNFGSQAAFLSGMKIARGQAVVLMDGDLQDPPQVIPLFVKKWKEGFAVVAGDRTSREEFFFITFLRNLFYRCLTFFGFRHFPHAGDFSLIDKILYKKLATLQYPYFWRTLRRELGFKQALVSYHRPARYRGKTNNSWGSNLYWFAWGLQSIDSKIPEYFFLLSSFISIISLATREISLPIFFLIELSCFQLWWLLRLSYRLMRKERQPFPFVVESTCNIEGKD